MSEQGQHIYIPDHRRDIVPSQRWVQVQFGGTMVASSIQTVLGRENGHWLREYYFPQQDVQMAHLEANDTQGVSSTYGTRFSCFIVAHVLVRLFRPFE